MDIAYTLNNDNNRLSPSYAHAVHTLWENPSMIRYHALFYVNHQGQFRANTYVMEILARQLDFIQSFTRPYNPCSFQNKVEEWLGIKAIEPDSDEERITLYDLLKQNIGKPLSDSEFHPVRQAILSIALKKRIVYIAPKRRDKLNPASLNPMLTELALPFAVQKSKKIWTITPITSSPTV